jgi:ABC-type lipoprotein release transport system permease subunit
VRPTDPLTYGTTALAFFAIAAGACFIPAWRAARLNPTMALREE